MTLGQIKKILPELSTLGFQLENGTFVPQHFHVTEIGKVTKNFIDCGGAVRNEEKVNFQLWIADDEDHRLKAEKLLDIIRISEEKLGIEDLEIEVEYQGTTIGRYDLDFNGSNFVLTNKLTACLAQDSCGIPPQKQKVALSELTKQNSGCSPGSGCC